MKVILLIMIGLSLLKADFTKTGDIVKDSVSKLEFQDDAVGSRMIWESAVAHCEALDLGGHSDWRLPNINELKSIVDRSKVSPAIVNGFENTSSSSYWSSTSYEGDKYGAWGIGFSVGSVYGDVKGYIYYVRCVRDGQ
jgi:hypothetical protein